MTTAQTEARAVVATLSLPDQPDAARAGVRELDDDQIMEIIKEVAPWRDEPKLNDLLTYEKSPPLFPQATYDVPSYRATKFVRAVERRILSALKKQVEELTKALGPFANFAEEQVLIAENMWLNGAQRERIGDWFGPTAFADAYRAASRMLFAEQGKIIGERNDKNR